MHIILEAAEQFSIQAYDNHEIKVDSITYSGNIIVSKHGVMTDWPIDNIQQLNEKLLEPLLCLQPNIILIAHKQQGQFPSPFLRELVAKKRIGLECMDIGAACRTYNILLNEQREVVMGIINQNI